jgi:inner membrane protein
MDNVTHALTGLMLSRAGLNRLTPHGAAILILAANAPDIDVAAAMGGSLQYLECHRGFTHSLIAIPLMAMLPVVLVRIFARKPFPWIRAYLVSLAGAASHPLLDWTNMYGVRLLSPWSERWYRADIHSVVDVWIWAVLLLACAAPALSRLVSSEIGARSGTGRGWAVFALCFFVAYSFGRHLLHSRAVATLDARLYDNEAPLRVAAIPTPFNPFLWIGLVETKGYYSVYDDLNLLREFDPAAGTVLLKPSAGPEIERARNTEAFRVFLTFSQYPLWRVTPLAEPEGGKRVEAMDLRFGAPPQPRFVATAVLDRALQVERSWFAFGAISVPDSRR